MATHDVYLGYLAFCVGLGVALGLAMIALQFTLHGIFYLCLFTWAAIETTLNTLPQIVMGAAGKLLRAVMREWHVLTGQIRTGISTWTEPSVYEEPEPALIIPVIKDWEAACMLLGLPVEGFSKKDLSHAYRIAMRAAHPDLGGHPEMAKAFNIARDLIRESKNWS